MRLSIGTTISDDVYCGSESSKAWTLSELTEDTTLQALE